MPIRVLIVDDHPVVRQGLRVLLEVQDGIEVTGEAGDGPTALRLSFATGEGFHRELPASIVEGTVVASDGELTDLLGLGDVGRAQAATNVTRVTRSRRASTWRSLTWHCGPSSREP